MEEEDQYIIQQRWTDVPSLDAHRASEHFTDYFS